MPSSAPQLPAAPTPGGPHLDRQGGWHRSSRGLTASVGCGLCGRDVGASCGSVGWGQPSAAGGAPGQARAGAQQEIRWSVRVCHGLQGTWRQHLLCAFLHEQNLCSGLATFGAPVLWRVQGTAAGEGAE